MYIYQKWGDPRKILSNFEDDPIKTKGGVAFQIIRINSKSQNQKEEKKILSNFEFVFVFWNGVF